MEPEKAVTSKSVCVEIKIFLLLVEAPRYKVSGAVLSDSITKAGEYFPGFIVLFLLVYRSLILFKMPIVSVHA
jgi:hypothetical protein